MNREELTWALNAVLPHAKTVVGVVDVEESTRVFASDFYSFGVAELPRSGEALAGVAYVPVSEVKGRDGLLNFVKPQYVADRTQEVQFAARPGELHVAYENDAREIVSAVFETTDECDLTHNSIFKLGLALATRPPAEKFTSFDPEFWSRFAKASANAKTDPISVRIAAGEHGEGLAEVFTKRFYGGVVGRRSIIIQDAEAPETEGKSV